MDFYDQYLRQYSDGESRNNQSSQIAKDSINSNTDKSNDLARKQSESDVAKTSASYKDLYDQSALQQLVNERELERRQANLGLTDSGLTKSQMTAIQVSRGNADAGISKQKQAATDSINQQLEAYIAQNEIARTSALSQIDYQTSIANNNLYNTLMSNAATNKANLEAAQIQAEASQANAANTAKSDQLKQDYDYAKYLLENVGEEAAYKFIDKTYGADGNGLYIGNALGIDMEAYAYQPTAWTKSHFNGMLRTGTNTDHRNKAKQLLQAGTITQQDYDWMIKQLNK